MEPKNRNNWAMERSWTHGRGTAALHFCVVCSPKRPIISATLSTWGGKGLARNSQAYTGTTSISPIWSFRRKHLSQFLVKYLSLFGQLASRGKDVHVEKTGPLWPVDWAQDLAINPVKQVCLTRGRQVQVMSRVKTKPSCYIALSTWRAYGAKAFRKL